MKIRAVCMSPLPWLCVYPDSRTIPHPRALLAPHRGHPQGCRAPRSAAVLYVSQGVFSVLVKTILKSHFPLIKYGFVTPDACVNKMSSPVSVPDCTPLMFLGSRKITLLKHIVAGGHRPHSASVLHT